MSDDDARCRGESEAAGQGRSEVPAVKPPTQDDRFFDWLAGFAAGEGCFCIHKKNHGSGFSCTFRIGLKENDIGILEEIKKRTGLGGITHHAFSQNGKERRTATWAVQSINGCLKLIEIFDVHRLRARKVWDYLLWRDAVVSWASMQEGGWANQFRQRDWSYVKILQEIMVWTRNLDSVEKSLA